MESSKCVPYSTFDGNKKRTYNYAVSRCGQNYDDNYYLLRHSAEQHDCAKRSLGFFNAKRRKCHGKTCILPPQIGGGKQKAYRGALTVLKEAHEGTKSVL